jgi:glycosyltransferase involved in cell wall biosynthesis
MPPANDPIILRFQGRSPARRPGAGAMQPSPGIYFFYPEYRDAVGGMYIAYRHVDLLNQLGYPAWMVHPTKGFRCTWFENRTPVLGSAEVSLQPGDVCVLPEIFEPWRALACPGIKRLIFNQNAYYTFTHHCWQKDSLATPYNSPDVLGVIVVSEDNWNYLAHAFPGLRLFRYRYSIDGRKFAPRWPKQKMIAFMPRKGLADVQQVLNIIKFRGELGEYALRPLEGLSRAEVAVALGEAEVFLSSGFYEGCPLPPMEAMACGCLVVGYHGFGGREYFRPEFSFPVEPADVQGFARTLGRVLRQLREDPGPLREMALQASRYITREYTDQREEQSVRAIWQAVLGGLDGRTAGAAEGPGMTGARP